MKRIGQLFDKIYQRNNLSAALWAASCGKREGFEAKQFRQNADQQLNELSLLLRTGQYEFSGYRCFSVRDTKTRIIHAPTFRDRVVHHAMVRVLRTAFMRSVHPHSYACMEGRGQLKPYNNWCTGCGALIGTARLMCRSFMTVSVADIL